MSVGKKNGDLDSNGANEIVVGSLASLGLVGFTTTDGEVRVNSPSQG